MKDAQIKNLKEEELEAKLVELRKELIKNNAQMGAKTGTKGVGNIRKIKKTIARIKTMLNEKATIARLEKLKLKKIPEESKKHE
ncbi:50S ribosomal protein L29 [Candidatus Woesearchaeota archaeon]|nr:50S ribosomal protein L29 [Candidatus Woesearchaeota archaeon]